MRMDVAEDVWETQTCVHYTASFSILWISICILQHPLEGPEDWWSSGWVSVPVEEAGWKDQDPG